MMDIANLASRLFEMDMAGQPVGMWLAFLTIVLSLLVIDLGVLNRKDRIVTSKESLLFTAGYAGLATVFGIWLWGALGQNHGMDYFTAYVIELSLSLDNLFLMSMILTYFSVPKKYQHRVLFWGILGVLVMRGIMIGLGSTIIHSFGWVLFIFAGFLVVTGLKMLLMEDNDDELKDNPLISFLQRHLRCTKEIDGHKFFVFLPQNHTGKMSWHATPLFMALITIELMDLLFALDSVPAVFAITDNSFVVYTSNIFAILGLRTMYFAITAMLDRFKYIKYSLALVLVFIGGKVFYGKFVHEIPPMMSLSITILVLLSGVVYSLIRTRSESNSSNQ